MEGSWEEAENEPHSGAFARGGSMIDLSPQTEEEMEAIRTAVVQREGLLLSVFDVLRRVPRRVLMVLKLNDLTRCVSWWLKLVIAALTRRRGHIGAWIAR